jgi:hypothetical protein
MAAKDVDTLIQLKDILGSTKGAETGTILLQTGDVGTGFTETDSVEYWQTSGIYSCPPSPTPGKSATQACVIRRGDTDICIATRDLRGQSLAGDVGPGETMIFAAGADGASQGRMLLKNDSSVNIYTKSNPGAQGMAIMLTPSSDTFSINTAAGTSIVGTPTSLTLTVGAASLTLNSDGSIQLVGTGQVQVDGSSILLGSQAVPGVNSALVGPTGISGRASLKCVIE